MTRITGADPIVYFAPWALLLVALALADSTQLWDRDEAYYARTAVEMLHGGDWLIPHFNSETFAHKPPLGYWLISLSMVALGESELAARLCSALALLATALLTRRIAARLFDAETGRWSAVILMTAILPLILGSLAMLDMVLLMFITLGIWAFVEQIHQPKPWWRSGLWMTVAMGGSMLTKFPIGPVVLMSMVLTSLAIGRRSVWAGPLPLLATAAAMILGLAIFLAWAIPADLASGGKMLEVGLVQQVLSKVVHPMEGHGASSLGGYLALLPVYAPVLVIGFFPWAIHLPASLAALLYRDIGGVRARAILWGWIAPTFVMFSLAATKLPHYILPLFPAVAILVAATLTAHRHGQLSDGSRAWLRGGAYLFGVMAAISMAALPVIGWVSGGAQTLAQALVPAIALALSAAAVIRWQLREQLQPVNLMLMIATPLILFASVYLVVLPLESRIKPGPAIASLLTPRIDPGTLVYAHGYREPGLVFYLRRPVENPIRELPESAQAIAAWSKESTPAMLIVPEQELATIEAQTGPLDLARLGSVTTVNFNDHARESRLLLVARRLPAVMSP
ncbi:hypothetical protein CCR95_01565 [Thiocystis minor]|uniref:glycosyltransferase family 39 protein n=1 Tax=Thiocystis minor TaxID=61597 RepID=UPI001914A35E|nr:glycosyltransferase family 39 protein [Thiocystis minor]MBK5962814.1 hypothetical protein [Thiocystis minor]